MPAQVIPFHLEVSIKIQTLILTFFFFYGDAKVVGNDSCLELTHSVSSSGGRVMYKQPFKVFLR
jgi:hypothetical protein